MSDIPSMDEWLRTRDIPLSIPYFPRKKKTVTISEEAEAGLVELCKFLYPKYRHGGNSISSLLEAIGLYRLSVVIPQDYSEDFDEKHLYTNECYEAGKDDAKEGRPPDFTSIYGDTPRIFYEFYMRGYLEIKAQTE